MNFIERLMSQLISKDQTVQKNEIQQLIKESIKPTKKFLEDFNDWILSKEHHGLLSDLKEKSDHRRMVENSEVNYFEVQDNSYRGFYFYGESIENKSDYSFLVHYFVQKLLEQGYYTTNTLREVIEENGVLITVEQFYLKPSLKFRRSTPYVQLFGNIEIEHKIEDEETKMIKLLSTVYSDQHYKEPLEFEQLLDELFLI